MTVKKGKEEKKDKTKKKSEENERTVYKTNFLVFSLVFLSKPNDGIEFFFKIRQFGEIFLFFSFFYKFQKNNNLETYYSKCFIFTWSKKLKL